MQLRCNKSCGCRGGLVLNTVKKPINLLPFLLLSGYFISFFLLQIWLVAYHINVYIREDISTCEYGTYTRSTHYGYDIRDNDSQGQRSAFSDFWLVYGCVVLRGFWKYVCVVVMVCGGELWLISLEFLPTSMVRGVPCAGFQLNSAWFLIISSNVWCN